VAIDLFAANGYDETTVDDIARAAGISLRSFFRYFASKGDLMSYALLRYGNQLAAAIDACPPDSSLREVFRESISRIAHLGVTREVRTRKLLGVLSRSQAALVLGEIRKEASDKSPPRGANSAASSPSSGSSRTRSPG